MRYEEARVASPMYYLQSVRDDVLFQLAEFKTNLFIPDAFSDTLNTNVKRIELKDESNTKIEG